MAYVPAHLPELTDLWISAWRAAMPMIDFEARRSWFVDHLSAMHARGVAIVCAFAERDGALCGALTVDPADGHIDQLVVAPSAWGQGAALRLLNEAKRLSPARLYLDVNQENFRAVRFYEREGFHRGEAGINPSSKLATWRYTWAAEQLPMRVG